MPRSLGNKRKQVSENGDHKGIGFITRLYGDFEENEFVKSLPNAFFGYWRVTVEQPLSDENGNDVTTRGDGNPKPDPKLRDYENIPFLKKDRDGNLVPQTIEAYVDREVEPHLPNAWIDERKPKPAMKSSSPNIFTNSNPCALWRKSKPTSWPWKPVLWNWKKQCWRIDHG